VDPRVNGVYLSVGGVLAGADPLPVAKNRPADLVSIPLRPDSLKSLPALHDGTELVVEIPPNFQGGWANVSPGSYWWREALATMATLATNDAEVRQRVGGPLNDDRCAWVRVEGPGCKPVKMVHALGALARRDLAAESRPLADLCPGEIVEVLEVRTTTCAKRLQRAKIATLLAPSADKIIRSSNKRDPGRAIVGWVSTKTLIDPPPELEPRTFRLVNFDREPLRDTNVPGGDPRPIPPIEVVPSASFDVPPGYGPGDHMTVAVPRNPDRIVGSSSSSSSSSKDNSLVYTIRVPSDTKPGGKFRVKLLSPLLGVVASSSSSGGGGGDRTPHHRRSTHFRGGPRWFPPS